MKPARLNRIVLAAVAAVLPLLPARAMACAACFGQSDSPMAKGMNAGIFTLLLVITSVLVTVAIFFAYILRRASRLSKPGAAETVEGIAPAAAPVSQPIH